MIEEMSSFGKTNRKANGGASESGVVAGDKETNRTKTKKQTNKQAHT